MRLKLDVEAGPGSTRDLAAWLMENPTQGIALEVSRLDPTPEDLGFLTELFVSLAAEGITKTLEVLIWQIQAFQRRFRRPGNDVVIRLTDEDSHQTMEVWLPANDFGEQARAIAKLVASWRAG